MSVVIKNDEKREWVVEHGSEDHSTCPGCDTDVEPSDGFGGEHGTPRMWSQYVHDRREGGCGATWTVTTQAGLERNTERGQTTKWVTQAASSGRSYSVPSKSYEEGWSRIYGR